MNVVRKEHDVTQAVAYRLGVDVLYFQERNKKVIENRKWMCDENTEVAV